MRKGKIWRARIFWTTGVAATFIWAVPAFLWGQNMPFSQEQHSTMQSPFTGLENSLTNAADAILAADSTQAQAVETPKGKVAIQLDQLRARNNGSLLAQTVRLNLLRPAIDPILRQSGVPVELAAVILVESGARPAALSSKGARGLWQLMPDTARRYGLRVDDSADDRLDVEKSTRAAAHYLSDLHLQFGSWTMALAAYNTGEQNIQRAISRSRSLEFNDLSSAGLLPLETRNYVPRVLAVMQSLGQPLVLAEYHRTTSVTTVFASTSH